MDPLLRGALERRETEHELRMAHPAGLGRCRFCRRSLAKEDGEAAGVHRVCSRAERALGGPSQDAGAAHA
jgi:hypothetical protein